jgi:hypothetical protein
MGELCQIPLTENGKVKGIASMRENASEKKLKEARS